MAVKDVVMLGRLIGIKLIRRAERNQTYFKPNSKDSIIQKAQDAGFEDINGQLTQQGERLINFFKMKSSKLN